MVGGRWRVKLSEAQRRVLELLRRYTDEPESYDPICWTMAVLVHRANYNELERRGLINWQNHITDAGRAALAEE